MKKSLIAFTAMVLFSAAFADYVPEAWNIEARKNFAAQRFGIFIHFGLYSSYAQGEWYLKNGRLDESDYARMMYGFCPSKFNAEEWVRIIKDSGAKYLTITSRHHDGFSLWPTKVDDGYNIANTPFKRDILGELAQACEREGIQLNFYYSLMDWHRQDYPPGDQAITVKIDRKVDYAAYKRFMLGQIAELIDRYHPGNIWFDGEWEHARKRGDKWVETLDWEFDSIYDFIHSKRVLVANNNHRPIRPKEDIQLFERNLPGDGGMFSKNQPLINDRPLEQCDVIQQGIWGYRVAEKRVRSAANICTMIVRSAAKNSNLLMNVGPDGSGQFPAQAVAALKGVGEWMRKNGHAIYGTSAGPVQDKEIVSTQKSGVVYLFRLTEDFPVLLTDEAEIKQILANAGVK